MLDTAATSSRARWQRDSMHAAWRHRRSGCKLRFRSKDRCGTFAVPQRSLAASGTYDSVGVDQTAAGATEVDAPVGVPVARHRADAAVLVRIIVEARPGRTPI